jgi:hypothetical protein
MPADEPGALASAVEFVLEALYVNNRLCKYAYRSDFAGHVHLPNSSLTLPFGGPYHTSIVRLSN